MAGKLTIHVLDTVRGVGAAQMRVEFRRLDPDPSAAAAVILDIGGRATLVPEGKLTGGRYEILFLVGDYHRALDLGLDAPPFFDAVPVRFTVADAEAHYHIPLIVSPFGYSTYRGG